MNRLIGSSNSLLLLASLLLSSLGCAAAVTVTKEDVPEVVQDFQANVVTHGELSLISLQYLRMHGLDVTAAEDPVAFLESIEQTDDDERLTKLYTLAEYALKVAVDFDDTEPEAAGDWFLLAAEQAYQGTFLALRTDRAAWDYHSNRLRDFYQLGVAGFVLSEHKRGKGAIGPHTRAISGRNYWVSIAQGEHLLDPNEFEELLLSYELQFKGLSNRHLAFGLSVPFVGFRENTRQQPVEEFYPAGGIVRGLSALLTFAPGSDEASTDVSLAFYDSRDAESTTVDGVPIPLAADYTAPLGYLLSKYKRSALNAADTFHPEAALSDTGYSLMEPYDDKRIPLITVHGLFSHPLTWVDVHNDLMADPVIRKHYQIWHFSYPPGLPVLEAARLFREKTDELYEFFDADRKSKAMNSTVIVAHSMGGLLTKTVLTDSGTKIVEAHLKVPIEELEITPEDKEKLREMLFFESRSYVKRVIFIAVPHRGSHISDNYIGWIGRRLTSAPKRYAELMDRVLSGLSEALRPEAKEAAEQKDNSIKNLSPNDPTIKALSELSIDAEVPFHSIIGDQGIGNGEEGTDGVVTYKSAHLEGAESELIVPTNHGAHHHPFAILELKRILKLHLVQLGSDS
jgi:alpha-beta hydrolase superfamily lysophospholipase